MLHQRKPWFELQSGAGNPSRFPCCVLSYFSLVFVMEHKSNWKIQVIRVSWVGQSTRGNPLPPPTGRRGSPRAGRPFLFHILPAVKQGDMLWYRLFEDFTFPNRNIWWNIKGSMVPNSICWVLTNQVPQPTCWWKWLFGIYIWLLIFSGGDRYWHELYLLPHPKWIIQLAPCPRSLGLAG